jgi:tetratricopeptide (TPR) repeat protein
MLTKLAHPGAIVGILVLVASAASGDECAPSGDLDPAVRHYTAAVSHYRARRFATAGARLRALSDEGVDTALAYFRQYGWGDDCLLAATLLHTEVGMAALLREPPARELDTARKLTDLVRDDAERERIHRDWLLLMGLFYQKMMFDPETFGDRRTEVLSLGSRLFREAQRYFDDAVEAFPRDPEILVAAGALFEWSGTRRFGEPAHLRKAERYYQRAIELDRNDPHAHLRYGITLWKRGRREVAVAPLAGVLELPSDVDSAFRAHVALGRIDMLDGNHESAIAHFRAARQLKPNWQVGALALSHALHVAGARDEARGVLVEGLTPRPTRDDIHGWWSYETGLSRRFGPLLERMREEVLY